MPALPCRLILQNSKTGSLHMNDYFILPLRFTLTMKIFSGRRTNYLGSAKKERSYKKMREELHSYLLVTFSPLGFCEPIANSFLLIFTPSCPTCSGSSLNS